VCAIAAGRLVEHGKSLAAEHFHVEPSQVDYAAGTFRVRDGSRSITLAELARARPGGRSLAVVGEGTFGSTFPNGCHVAEVEIDPRTGTTEIVAYTAVDDCGEVINHAVVEGQMHGALAQGAGQVFGEHAVYDPESGQMLTGSFMDYYMPRAGLLPEPKLGERPTPSKVSPLGVKGMGESGCTASLGALVNAMTDALRPLGVPPLDMPFTPLKVWQAVAGAKGGR
jgi:carbon-monoxide dehydrogenase large subunit